jgi:diguanylate cyclase (GGDEF)-like protein
MAENRDKIQEKLMALQDDYLKRLPQEISDAQGLWSAVRLDESDAESLKSLYRLMHRLNGSGMTFGFPDISHAASAVEEALQEIVNNEKTRWSDCERQIEAGLEQMHELVNRLFKSREEQADAAASADEDLQEEERALAELFFFESGAKEETADLKQQMQYFGYSVLSVSRIDDIKKADQQPSILIVDLDDLIDTPSAFEALSMARADKGSIMPMITISSRNDMSTRLQAVRAGSSAYFLKPVEASQVVDTLDQLTHRRPSEPYRILIVDDDDNLANYYAGALRHAGMSTQIIHNPLEVLTGIEDFSPDLVLMDLYMPQCTGLELAAVIRQQHAYVSIPLVFLSTETNINQHLNALQLGGDDFLNKPIVTKQLVASITARVQRARILKSFMVRDSLTGLLNHTTIFEHLNREFARAKRYQSPLSFVMLDIDHFKAVNDTHGHLTGDRVLKNLSRLLQQRLRQTDVIGRYGGEEFGIILIGPDTENALKLMNNIREQFSQLRQQSDVEEFHVTLSCGLAEIANHNSPHTLKDAADKALYQAKRSGRNRVAMARHES